MYFFQKNKIMKLLLIINMLFLFPKEEVINNPLQISEHSNPIINATDTKYLIYTSGEKLIANKENCEVDSTSSFPTFSSPYVLCIAKDKNYYLFSRNNPNNIFYLITSTNTNQSLYLQLLSQIGINLLDI